MPESYRTRKMFGSDFEEAANHICREIAKFYAARVAEREAKKAG